LDSAAEKHAQFLVDNHAEFQINNVTVPDAEYLTHSFGGILGGHYEYTTAAHPTNYRGASPQARATAAGYSGSVYELMTFGAPSGADCIASLENSVYHLIALVSPFTDLGIGYNAGAAGGPVCVIELGVKSTTLGQLPDAGPVFYPYAGQTGVLPTFYNQAEVPVPAPDLPKTGHPVAVSLYSLANPSLIASDIMVQTFSITPHSGGTPLSVRVLAKTGVVTPTSTPDDVIPGAGFVVLLPTTPLTANTTYDLSFSATVKGVSVTKTWAFTTGNAN
jgi:hypothetical protein